MKKELKVLDKLKINLDIKENILGFDIDTLFEMGARINPKRSFLFISKLLGKHLEVMPNVPKLSGHLLSNLLNKQEEDCYFSDVRYLVECIETGVYEDEKLVKELSKTSNLNEHTLFIGFAETATGLGHAVASAFGNSTYVHTTREVYLDKKSIFDFEEEHSHATSHYCYLENIKKIEESNHLVLIDDEITTGNTCLNLIKSLSKKFPNKKYTILTLLDWRTKEYEDKYLEYEKETGTKIDVLSLLKGEIEVIEDFKFTESTIDEENNSKERISNVETKIFVNKNINRVCVKIETGEFNNVPRQSGQFGVNSKEMQDLEELSEYIAMGLKGVKKYKNTLFLGNGELIYFPSRIASYMGKDVLFKSSTRSPIYISNTDNYPIKDRISYVADDGVTYYVYNLKSSKCEEVFMFFENVPSQRLRDELSKELSRVNVKSLKLVII